LKINSTVSAARQILVSVVLEYLRRYPDMKVDVVTEGRLIDIVADGFDAGIRTRDVVPGDMIAVPFGANLRFAVVGSPAYFEKNPPPDPRRSDATPLHPSPLAEWRHISLGVCTTLGNAHYRRSRRAHAR
jgi:DNA-binding transcriptional LysR family regulator